MIYDIIGDVHGHANKLIGLLNKLGYQHDGKSYVAPKNHQAVFIGDLVDRGPRQLDTLKIVFDMLDNKQALAVMGNHEYNAIAYATPNHITNDGEYLRPHTKHNTLQHQAFLDEVGFGTPLHQFWLNRLYELPLFIENQHAIFIHACYDKSSLDHLLPLLKDNKLTKDALQKTAQKGTKDYIALEFLLKGLEAKLPNGHSMTDKTGIVRTNARVKWWLQDWQHLPISQSLLAKNLPNIPLENLPQDLLDFRIKTNKPIFIGHYWQGGTPACLSNQVVCVDYSAGGTGPLTAYQFDTDNPTLNNDNFVWFTHS